MLPRNIAMELALTGDPIDAERAYELGLVNRLAEPGEALDTALELADAIAVNGPAGAGGDEADPRRVRRLARGRSSAPGRARSSAR